MSLGIDCASHAPAISALKAAKVQFVCRYLAPSGKSYDWKRTDRAEATRLRNAGIDFVTVWESSAKRPRSGRSAGIDDAHAALSAAQACGMPVGAPIYFAVDYDVPESDQPQINAYFEGIASVLGKTRVGAYGGYWPLKRLFDGGHINYGWQTTAWSGGHWDPRAHIRQQGSGKVGGVSVDWDHSLKPDFGQWRTATPKPSPSLKPAPIGKPAAWSDPPNAKPAHLNWIKQPPWWQRYGPKVKPKWFWRALREGQRRARGS